MLKYSTFFALVLVFWVQSFVFGAEPLLWTFNVYPEKCKSGDFVYIVVTVKNNSTKSQKIIPFYSRDKGLLRVSIQDKETGNKKSFSSRYKDILINRVELQPNETRLCCFDFIQVAVPNFTGTDDKNFWKKLNESEHEYWLTCSLHDNDSVKNFEKKLLIDKITTDQMNAVKKASRHIKYGELNVYCTITDLQVDECKKLYQDIANGTLKNYFKMNYFQISVTNKILVSKEGRLHPKSHSAKLTEEQRNIAFNDFQKWLPEINPIERIFLVTHSLINIGTDDNKKSEDNIQKNYRLLLEKTLETEINKMGLKFDSNLLNISE
jgi:hypothetical protein